MSLVANPKTIAITVFFLIAPRYINIDNIDMPFS